MPAEKTSANPAHDQTSQRQKMESGELYLADDAELTAASRRAYLLTREYEKQYAINQTDPHKVLEELLGSIAPDVHIKPPFFVDYGKYITMGEGTFANYGLMALDVAPITIGKDVLLGPNVQLLTPTHPVDIELRRAKYEAAKPIVIQDNAWLGGGVIVLAGVTIGENSVIGAGSVVTRNVPANVVAVGNPARVVRTIGTIE